VKLSLPVFINANMRSNLNITEYCAFLVFFVGKSKCMMKSGDCVVKHPGIFTTGLKMVVSEK